MIRYNIKQSVRGMMRNKTFTFLNISGFAVGFALCIIIMVFVYQEYAVDTAFIRAKDIYRLVDIEKQTVGIDDEVIDDLQGFAGVQLAVPVIYDNWEDTESKGFLQDVETGKYIETREALIATNNDFFEVFGITMLVGNANKPFADNKSIVLSKSVALKLFGTTEVLNKLVKRDEGVFRVSAVVEDMPQNTSMRSGIFIHNRNPDYVVSVTTNKNGTFYRRNIYMLLDTHADVSQLTAALNANFPNNKGDTKVVALQPLLDIYMGAPLQDDAHNKASKWLLFVFLAIALITLVMSVFNYVNFMISRQMETLKNAGIRITNGAMPSQIRSYYFTEVVIAITMAFALAVLIAELAMPFAQQLLGENVGLHWLLQPQLFAMLAALIVVVIFLSAIAPIVFISRFKVQTLFGKTNINSHKHPIKKVMNISQLAISIMLLVAVFVVHKQLRYVKSTDVGFQSEHLLRLNIPWNYDKSKVLKNEFSKLPFVEYAALSSNSPGSGWNKWGMMDKWGQELAMYVIRVDKDYLHAMGIALQQGNVFKDSDVNKAYYLTNYAFEKMGWDNIEDIKLGAKHDNKVVGVVNDIFYNSLHSQMVPVAFFYTDEYFGELNLKLRVGNVSEQMRAIAAVWKQQLGAEPMSFNFYDQYFNALYKKEEQQAQALSLFSLIAFMITCLGLLGQVLQTTQNRIKEIGIRKINGASAKEVMLLLNKSFVKTVAVAFVIATPIAYYSMRKWLESFAYKTALSWWVFALAGISALAIALLTVSWQSWRAASRNPVEALRYE